LTEEDLLFVEKHFGTLVDIAMSQGTIHPEFIPLFFQKFIYEKHVDALSDVALSVLAQEVMKKPVSERPVSCFGSTIITNPGHRENMKQRLQRRRDEEERAIVARQNEEIDREIKKAAAVAKKEAAEANRIAVSNRYKLEAQAVYEKFKNDVQAFTQHNVVVDSWTIEKVTLLKSAYRKFISPRICYGSNTI